jgi:plasmid stability protein
MNYNERVGKMVQIRNVREDVHRELKVRAARAGMSLSEFLNAELERLVAHRPLDELIAETSSPPSLRRGEAAAAVRAGRRQ